MPEFTAYPTGTPCWVDVTSPELERTVSFYSDFFGWEAEQDPRPEAGGVLLMEPFDVFDAGRMAVAQDPTGAVFGIWQAGAHHGAQLASEPGTLVWNECQTTDSDAAEAFYRAVFDYDVDRMQMGDEREYRVLTVDGKGVAGMMELDDVPPNWSTTFAVEDADAAVAEAEKLGARGLVPPFDIPEVGRYAVLQDPVGAVFGVLAG